MKIKVSLIVFLFTFGFLTVNAQAPIGIGEAQINAGLGFSSNGVPVYAGFDIGVHEDITVHFVRIMIPGMETLTIIQ
jgi:outer membrane immunogenic protein